jgi:hypothetical protein
LKVARESFASPPASVRTAPRPCRQHAASQPPATARASGFGAISGLTTTRAYANIQALEAVHYQVKTRSVFLHLQGTQVAYGGAGMLVASIPSGFCIHTSAKLL